MSSTTSSSRSRRRARSSLAAVAHGALRGVGQDARAASTCRARTRRRSTSSPTTSSCGPRSGRACSPAWPPRRWTSRWPSRTQYPRGKYLLVFDPLDGSSNIEVNVSVGIDLLGPARAPARRGPGRGRLPAARHRAGRRGLRHLRPVDDARAHGGRGRRRLHARPRARRVLAHAPRHPRARDHVRVRDQHVATAASGRRRSSATSRSASPGRPGRAARTSTCAGSPRSSPRRTASSCAAASSSTRATPRTPASPAGCACSTSATRSACSSSRRAAARAPARCPVLEVVPTSLHQRIGFVFGSAAEVEHHRATTTPSDAPDDRRRDAAVQHARPVPPARLAGAFEKEPTMSAKHPIIAITGSSGRRDDDGPAAPSSRSSAERASTPPWSRATASTATTGPR